MKYLNGYFKVLVHLQVSDQPPDLIFRDFHLVLQLYDVVVLVDREGALAGVVELVAALLDLGRQRPFFVLGAVALFVQDLENGWLSEDGLDIDLVVRHCCGCDNLFLRPLSLAASEVVMYALFAIWFGR